MSNKIYYPATVTPYDDGPGYMMTFRDVPQAITGGETFVEAIDMAMDALLVSRDFYIEDGKPFPVPSCPQAGDVMIPSDFADDDDIWYRHSKQVVSSMGALEDMLGNINLEPFTPSLPDGRQVMFNKKSDTPNLLDDFNKARSTMNGDSKPLDLGNMFKDMKTIVAINDFGTIVMPENTKLEVSTGDVLCGCVLVKSGDRYLGVSRKDNHSDIGLPGGKCELNEHSYHTAIRETLEETGFLVNIVKHEPFEAKDQGYHVITYLAELTNETATAVYSTETGLSGFFTKEETLNGSFGKYNTEMFKHFGL